MPIIMPKYLFIRFLDIFIFKFVQRSSICEGREFITRLHITNAVWKTKVEVNN